jgi:hypothetical protein
MRMVASAAGKTGSMSNRDATKLQDKQNYTSEVK